MSTVETQSADALVYNLQSNLTGDLVAAGAENGTITLYKVENDIPSPIQELCYSTSAIFSILFTEERIIASTYDGHLLVWKLTQAEYAFESSISVFQGCINSISIHKEDVICGCSDGRIRRVTMAGSVSMECTAHKHGITGIASHKDYIITSGIDGLVKIWNDTDLSLLQEIKEHTMAVRDCKVCTNDLGVFIFATCGEDGLILIFTEEKDKPLKFTIDRHQIDSTCNKLAWTQVGYSLAVGYGTEEVKIFTPSGPGKWKESSIILP